MKRILTILLAILPLMVAAQMVQPVKWSGEEVGDSVRLKAAIEPNWHMTIIEFGDREYEQEFTDSFVVTVAKADLTPIRFNACDDKMCTAPEVWSFESTDRSADRVQNTDRIANDGRSLWVIFLLGLLGGLLAIFTPCVWPIIPMTVSFFMKKGGGLRDAVLYGLSIIILYVGLGLLVTVLFGASALNDLSTNAVVNIIFFLILVINENYIFRSRYRDDRPVDLLFSSHQFRQFHIQMPEHKCIKTLRCDLRHRSVSIKSLCHNNDSVIVSHCVYLLVRCNIYVLIAF